MQLSYDLAIAHLGAFPKKNEGACSYKDLYWNILSTCIHNGQKTGKSLEGHQWNAKWLVYSCNGKHPLPSHLRHRRISKHYAEWKQPYAKGYILYDPIYMFLGLLICSLYGHSFRLFHRRVSGRGPGLETVPNYNNNRHYRTLKGLALIWNWSITPILWMRKLGFSQNMRLAQSSIENRHSSWVISIPRLSFFPELHLEVVLSRRGCW